MDEWEEPSKEAVIKTKSYGKRALRCYETATPMFGDVGTGKIDDDGVCIVYLDDVFIECINTEVEYAVFLQPYGKGECYVANIDKSYFIVNGEPGLRFAWEIKCNQIANNGKRLEEVTNRQVIDNDVNTRILNELTYESELSVNSLDGELSDIVDSLISTDNDLINCLLYEDEIINNLEVLEDEEH